ncbi:MAG: hypothetical protein CO135_00690 [Candidatus Levybacteria bacterium CG_4_9_14_3_um_filter_35_16]|nr:MAG: hypothetical protein COW87_04605 [Candidatus Levybacteria bacterium CG22_combo_CG10-13_8_21_14_all_35_11]PIY94449.1 MAG: hypothetical protein COY68_02720 [Candidatus Levybacteria bacterium CG_4_10_14_0_8_um_filter_35_23]PJA91536.1 MAG: hypothetical protein CO135_00690 [Candidatus Levybacteria bacterium CG_4_9_14_3_um_filter_35_16]PJC54562.1 MAG: hypothetical protein CO028_01765 [Candidatus Levybacteria bacterium CG_4_9_14_0_2_um_filter_35_21]
MIVDLLFILNWWSLMFMLGIIFFPLTVLFFPNFFDRGYIFSKILAIAVLSYGIFLLGTLHLLPFTRINSIALLLVILITIFLKFVFVKKDKWFLKKELFLIIREKWKIILFEEILFLITLFFWAYIKSFQPEIHGLEKFMDFGFINSILRSNYFPAKDIWFTPLSINYYYFGHLVTAVLTKISDVPPNISFNLMLSMLFSLTFVASFSIGMNLMFFISKKKRYSGKILYFSGFITAFFVTFGGNFHSIYAFFKPYSVENPLPFWNLQFLPNLFPNSYWYPNATRFIHNTIHEFPIYSWVVSDLHGHVLDIPFVLLTIALLFSIFMSFFEQNSLENQKSKIKDQKYSFNLKILNFKLKLLPFNFSLLILLGFILAIMYMTNAWDGAIYLLLTFFVLFFLEKEGEEFKNKILSFKFFLNIIILIFSFILFTLPFSIYFKPFASGIGLLCAPDFLIKIGKIGPFLFEADHCQTSPFWQLMILYGFFYFLVFSFFALIFKSKTNIKDLFVIILIMISTILIFIPELIYLKDIYPAHFRANTMFKLVYQSFIMLSLSSGYIISKIVIYAKEGLEAKKRIIVLAWLIFFIPFFVIISIYPYFAINSYYGDLKIYQGLNGTKYLNNLYQDDYKAILWINKNIFGQPVILEAQGDSYTDYGRISSNTGLPTILGWTVHEWLWRGTYDIPAPRINEVKTLYETSDTKITNAIIKKYNVKFIYIGKLEKQKYSKLNETKFKKIGKIIFSNSGTKIYKIIL